MKQGIKQLRSRIRPPAGCVAGRNYWFRIAVEAWLAARLPGRGADAFCQNFGESRVSGVAA
jgi:hypothetical protein